MITVRPMALALIAVLLPATMAHAVDSVDFNYSLPQPNQTSSYEVDFELDINVKVTRNGEMVSDNHQHLVRRQLRHVTILEPLADRATKVEIRFEEARETLAANAGTPTEKIQPIEGKRYFVQRAGTGL